MATNLKILGAADPREQTLREHWEDSLESWEPPFNPIAPNDVPSEEEPVDLRRLRATVGDDPEDLRVMINLYLAEVERTMGGLGAAVRYGSAEEVERLAHRLGGASATCGMTGLVAPLLEMETSNRAGRRPNNQQLLNEARRQRDRISAYLAAHGLKGADSSLSPCRES